MSGHAAKGQRLLDAAEQSVTEELLCLANEQDAFREFKKKVEQIKPEEVVAPRQNPVGLGTRSSKSELTQVKNGYESTVMAVPHFSEDYDETYEENISHEFGTEVASLLLNTDSFSHECKQILVSEITQSIQQRKRLIRVIEKEKQSLKSFREPIFSINEEIRTVESMHLSECSFDSLETNYVRFEELEERCQSLLETRQETLITHDRTLLSSKEDTDIVQYLYEELDVSYPVLTILANTVESLKQHKTTIEDEIAHR